MAAKRKEHDGDLLGDDEHTYSKERVEALIDGVFATVMTVLVLGLVVPIITGPNVAGQLSSYIWGIFPNLVSYVITFMVLGVMWVGHNSILRYVHSVNRRFLWINVIFLIGIGITPFTTSFLGRYALEQPALIIYGINFLFIGIMLAVLRVYAIKDHVRTHGHIGSGFVAISVLKINFFSPVVYVSAIVASFLNPYVSLGLFAVVPLYYIVTGLTKN
jgi:uncharacterized membrane protein